MRFLALLSLVLLAASCVQSYDDFGAASADTDGTEADDAAADVATADSPMGGETSEDVPQQVEYPLPADPVPTPQPGTYGWTDGVNKVTFALNDGMAFLLEASFSCVGDTGCKVKNEFSKTTCNVAFDKGYYTTISDGIFVIEGVKKTDKLYGALQSDNSVALVYELTPSVSCCTDSFAIDATWATSADCSDYANPDCDPYTDQHCDEGMNCIFGAANKPVCMVAGEKQIGEECAGQGNCADGVCLSLEGTPGQYCYQYCLGAGACGYGLQCMSLEGEPWKVCSLSSVEYEKCNLLLQDCEIKGEACYLTSSPINQPICMTQGQGQKGDPCTSSTECQEGLDCIANKECMQLCDMQGVAPECEDTFTNCPKLYQYQNAGYCDE